MPHYQIHEVIHLVHYIEAATEAEACEIATSHGPLSPPREWDTEITTAEIYAIREYDPEG